MPAASSDTNWGIYGARKSMCALYACMGHENEEVSGKVTAEKVNQTEKRTCLSAAGSDSEVDWITKGKSH
jgi:hypothetical protein